MDKRDIIYAREKYIKLIKEELLGPGSEINIPDKEHELISVLPNTRYSLGILYPKRIKWIEDGAEEDDDYNDEEKKYLLNNGENDFPNNQEYSLNNKDDENERIREENKKYINKGYNNKDEEENLDDEVEMATQIKPSSMGITFFVSGNSDKVNYKLNFATYKKAKIPDCRIPIDLNDNRINLKGDFEEYLYFDKEENSIKLKNGNLTMGKVKELKEKYDKDLEQDNSYIIDIMYKLLNQLNHGYVREPHNLKYKINFGENDYKEDKYEIDGIEFKLVSLRKKLNDNITSVTIMLVNDEEGEQRANKCIYQPELIISTDDNEFIFSEAEITNEFKNLNDEEKSLLLQYRNKKNYGTGLGTAVKWEINNWGKGELKNDFFPEVEVPSMEFNLREGSDVDGKTLSMKYLSDMDKTEFEDKKKNLNKLVEDYELWIEEIENKSKSLKSEFSRIAEENIEGCKKSAERMHKGIEILSENKYARDAFQLANRAMFMQRAHLKLQEQNANISSFPEDDELTDILHDINNTNYKDIDKKIKDKYAWRPFQIAFLLMSIESIVDDKSEDRGIVDLIWFPTGGGKTEAYLGLTAFSIFYRRLKYPSESSGTTVIMRYTLRLLTAQQFTRASTLICACEYIRKDATSRKSKYGKYPLGKERITIGLWIGGSHTPNKNKYAGENINKLLKATSSNIEEEKNKYNKFQVLKCPWCGTKLVKEKVDGKNKLKGTFGYAMKNNKHFELHCPQEECFFNWEERLPIQVVDEELYDNPPTLLFGTVDKFAMLPWNPKVGSFFGCNSKNRPPELIIQDELHLISGPLGTMIGLYETAIDSLCSKDNIKTKIIASTATIRKAREQCASLYNREVNQFPHPGIDAEDSFFARESLINYDNNVYGRKYIGIMPSGKTKAMMQVRAIAALMQNIYSMEMDENIKDKYWTLTVYFNSLRDLGKCSTLVNDDVKDFMRRIEFRLGKGIENIRKIKDIDELTSRITTTQLNETLEKLEKVSYSENNEKYNKHASDILLATNMISVGIDVARLNVMLLVGQPKLTSEYIQASSRVGRAYPGVVFTMYDSSKSRDRSHYEQFKSYHEAFYRYVEPTGVTPFSKPARDRALHAIIISLLRQRVESLKEDNAAGEFSIDKYKEEIEKITNEIVNRSNEISSKVNPNMKSEERKIREEIKSILEQWDSFSKNYEEFYYGEKFMFRSLENGQGRLIKPYNSARNDSAFDTMTSMRNVDTAVKSNILIWEDNDVEN